MEGDFWILLAANLPFLAAFFTALQKGWIVIGKTHDNDMKNKDEEIAFREQLRQEALTDKASLSESLKGLKDAMISLTDLVRQTLELNDRLLDNRLVERWDGNDRRSAKATQRTRRGSCRDSSSFEGS